MGAVDELGGQVLIAAARLRGHLRAPRVGVDAADQAVETRFEGEGAHDASVCGPDLDIGDPVELHSALRVEVDDAQVLQSEQLSRHLEIAQVHVVDDRVERLAFGGRLVGCLECREEGRRAFAVVD